MLEAVLPAKLVEARYASFAVANYVQRHNVDLASRALQAGQAQVLQELRMVLQGQQPKPLPSHRKRPVADAPLPHRLRRIAAQRRDDRDLAPYHIRILAQLAIFDQVRHHRVQSVDGDEFLGKIELRSKM